MRSRKQPLTMGRPGDRHRAAKLVKPLHQVSLLSECSQWRRKLGHRFCLLQISFVVKLLLTMGLTGVTFTYRLGGEQEVTGCKSSTRVSVCNHCG